MSESLVKRQKVRCCFCRRVLTDEQSIARRSGPECAGKLARQREAVTAGKAVERTLGDFKLHRLGAELRQLERLEVLHPSSEALQRDLQDARHAYAKRVEYLASAGMVTISEPPVPGVVLSDVTAQAEPMVTRHELCKNGTIKTMPLSEAVRHIQDESHAAAAHRAVIKQHLQDLRAGNPVETWHARYECAGQPAYAATRTAQAA